MTTDAATFRYLQDFVRRRTSIVLEDGKEYLVEARLAELARREGLATLADLVGRMRSTPDGALHERVADAMTTNETSFFRDAKPFELFRERVLPALVRARKATTGRIEIWSAACSTGQEPYSLAMLLRQSAALLDGCVARITATDLCGAVLEQARAGRFSKFDVRRGLDPILRDRYFAVEGEDWVAADELRRLIDFRRLNLAGPWPAAGPYDVVFLRNVLIYFDVATKRDIFAKVRRVLAPDGRLVLGGSETTLGVDAGFESEDPALPGFYRLAR
jgi:chemotaxis protein methyltransferase CheR